MLMLLLLAGAHILMLMMMFLLQSVNVIAALLDIGLMKIQMYKGFQLQRYEE